MEDTKQHEAGGGGAAAPEGEAALRIGKKEMRENALGLVLVIGVIVVAFWFFDIAEIKGAIERAGAWAPIFLILAKASTIVFAPLSGSPLYPLAGALFGFSEGFALLVAGDAFGGTISFYISRIFGWRIVERFVKADSSVIARALRLAGTPKGFLVVRVIFSALPEITSYAAGLTALRFAPFFLIFVGVGLIPTAFLAYFGSLLAVFQSPLGIGVILVVGTFSVIVGSALFGWWLKKM